MRWAYIGEQAERDAVIENLPSPKSEFTQVSWLHRDISNPSDAGTALRLSLRERQVLAHLLEGASRAHITAALQIRIHTVVDYLSEMYRKVGVKSHQQLLAHVAEQT